MLCSEEDEAIGRLKEGLDNPWGSDFDENSMEGPDQCSLGLFDERLMGNPVKWLPSRSRGRPVERADEDEEAGKSPVKSDRRWTTEEGEGEETGVSGGKFDVDRPDAQLAAEVGE